MHVRWRNRAVLVVVLVAALLAPLAQLEWEAGAQSATPAAATPAAATPAAGTALVPGAQTWQVLVNNVSPEGENWSFNTFYPDYIEAHPGDRIVSRWRRTPRRSTRS